ncbi:hypothetical protein HKX48_005785 [Thoreauomyces humboldtii]|nr:hypothetical protein HKX48_005785 [Thoreauomyces humboldtii]
MPSLDILVVGGGAVGAFYASRLQQPGVNVSVVCRSNYAAVKRNGFHMRTKNFGDYSFFPQTVFQNCSEAAELGPTSGYHYLVVATKALPDVSDDSEVIAPVVTAETVIVLIQNGVGIEDPYHARYPNNLLLTSVTVVSASQPDPGVIVQSRWTRISLGCFPPSSNLLPDDAYHVRSTATMERLVSLLQSGGISDAEFWPSVDMQMVRWHKIAINATFNPSSVLSGGNLSPNMLKDPLCRAHCLACMEEVFETAQQIFGRPFPEKLATLDAIVASIERSRGSKPSMLLDWEAGRPLELEVILGNPIRKAREHGLAMPRLESMYGLLHMMTARKRSD